MDWVFHRKNLRITGVEQLLRQRLLLSGEVVGKSAKLCERCHGIVRCRYKCEGFGLYRCSKVSLSIENDFD
ncbi:hypothetical protein HanIR_Chr09g0426361 [Helianthus annuus]|nr:hypothetical protein HanIR_Chr09g0426351 [Helianthus annuus]KAJ0535039.1 hypothetical protein HanIR_Chr09g0426361 [Helianthus annuus]